MSEEQKAPEVAPEVTPAPTPEVTPVESEKKHAPEEVAEDAVVAQGSTGNMEVAKSDDVLAASKEAEDEEDDGDFFPSFFVDEEDRHRIELDLLFDKTTKRVASVSRTGLNMDFSVYKTMKHTVEWFEFSVPDYNAISKYRQRSTVYRRESGTPVVDAVQLRNFLIVWHLKDWSLRDRNGNKVKLNFEDNGALADDSIQKVYKMPNAIIDVLMTIFERDVLLSE